MDVLGREFGGLDNLFSFFGGVDLWDDNFMSVCVECMFDNVVGRVVDLDKW